jgi:hypothetical protein
MMDDEYLQLVMTRLQERGVPVDSGLTKDEVRRIEKALEFTFPPDLKEVLQHALPATLPPPGALRRGRFPNWRHEKESSLRYRLDWPTNGLIEAIVDRGLWLSTWGDRPADLETELAVVHRAVTAAPKLIPVYGHRFMPSVPSQAGNPVLSIMGTDIIYYGYDLASYFCAEFQVPTPAWAAKEPRYIPFWSDLIDAIWGDPC